MRKCIFAVMLLLCACCPAWAGSKRLEASYGTNGTCLLVVTNNEIRGYVEEVLMDAPAAGVTGRVAVYVQPPIATMATINIATQAVSADVVIRPRVDATDIAGVALTSDPPQRYYLWGETVYMSVTNISVSTGITWTVIIKMSEE